MTASLIQLEGGNQSKFKNCCPFHKGSIAPALWPYPRWARGVNLEFESMGFRASIGVRAPSIMSFYNLRTYNPMLLRPVQLTRMARCVCCMHTACRKSAGRTLIASIMPVSSQRPDSNASKQLWQRWTCSCAGREHHGTSQHSNAQARVTCPGFARREHVMILRRWLAS